MSFIKKLIPVDNLKKTVRRFPGSAVCSFALFILVVLSIHDVIDVDEKIFGRIVVILSYGFFWFGLVRLIIEGKGWGDRHERLLGYGGFAVLAASVLFGSGFTLAWLLMLMIPALLLGISVGPYIDSKDNLSFWFYNRQTWQGASIAFLAGLLWWGGLSAALGAIDYLFGVAVPGEIYGDLWAFSAIVFAPLYALSWVPEKYQYSEEDCHAPPQLAFLINWVLAPLVTVYMLILYAYFVKIALAWELPRGQLSYMVMAFGGVGVMTYLAGWPLRENGGPLLKPLYKFFFPALIVPVVMQAMAIVMRIEQYGVTEQRYLVALSTVWFAVLAIAYTIKKPPLKFITGTLAIGLLVSALGPLSAPNVSERSQMGRLEVLLVKNEILVDGAIVKAEGKISFDDRKSISSGLDYLRDRKKLDRLRDWLPELKEKQSVPYPRQLTEQMGFEFVGSYQRKQDKRSENANLNSPRNNSLTDVSGYELLFGPQRVNLYRKKDQEVPKRIWELKGEAGKKVSAYYEDGQLFIGAVGQGVVGFDVEAFALREFDKDPSHAKRDLVMESANGAVRVKLIFTNINLRREIEEDGEELPYVLNGFNFKALIDY